MIKLDLTWTAHIQTQVKTVPSVTAEEIQGLTRNPENFLSGAIGSVLTQCISVWYGNSSNQDCKALQRVVCLAERISGSPLPSLQDIYLKRCKSRADKIIKDSNHPGNRLFILLPSGKRYRSMMAKTERLRRSFFPQATRLLNSNLITFTGLNLINCKTFTILIIRIAAMYIYPVQPVCTFLLHIPAYIIIC